MEKSNYYGGEYDLQDAGKVAAVPPGKVQEQSRRCGCFLNRSLPVKICMIIALVLFLGVVVIGGIGLHVWINVWGGDKDANLGEDAFSCTDGCIQAVDHSLWDEVLKEVITEGLEADGIVFNGIDYERLRTDTALRQKHLDYLTLLSTTNIDALSGDEALAFMLNVYNAFTVDLIVKKNVRGSIRDLTALTGGSVFDRFKWELTTNNKTEKVSLNNVEHQIIRKTLTEHDEPRVHGAVNCASVSCPDLRAEAFTAEKLDEQLDEQMNIWLQDEGKGIRIDEEKNEIHMSAIFKWFKEDFVATEHGGKNDVTDAKDVVEYAMEFATPEVQAYVKKNNPEVKFMPYNWDLIQS
ncbi:hypothetical protein BSKO_08788 [Bryopsis sp. KO-2023]|nr:hypothetical protein BSKO_08788 [Bryopsis sp. KO-2023]